MKAGPRRAPPRRGPHTRARPEESPAGRLYDSASVGHRAPAIRRHLWAPGARRVIWEFGFVRLKIIQNGIHQRPGRFHAIGAVKKRGVAAHAVIDQRSISGSLAPAKFRLITEIHGNRFQFHFLPRKLGIEGNRNSFIGLDIQHQRICGKILAAEHQVRRAAKLDGDFGDAEGRRLPVRK